MSKLSTGVCTGDVVSLRDSRAGITQAVVVGFVLTHPDTKEVWISWSGDGIQKIEKWPLGGSLTAEAIGLEMRGARDKFRYLTRSFLTGLGI